MVDSFANSLDAAYVLRARIHAFVTDAGLITWTIRTDHAFWMTSSDTRRNSLQSRQTFADCRVADLLADGIGAAWRWRTGIPFFWPCFEYFKFISKKNGKSLKI